MKTRFQKQHAIQLLPTLEELDAEDTTDDLRKATDDLVLGKAPGKGGILPEMKCAKGILEKYLYQLLCLCCKGAAVPQDIRDSNINSFYKNKEDKSDCNNYCGISLLNILGNLYACAVLKRIAVLPASIYPGSQYGFRAELSTTDIIFLLRQLQEKCRKQRMPLLNSQGL